MDSCAQFLAVAEHRLIPARVRSVGHQLRKADCHSVWAPACQDQISGGPGIIPCLAHSLGAGKEQDATSRFKLDDWDSEGFHGCLPQCIGCLGFLPGLHFSLLAEFQIRQWVADVACPCASQPIWPACWVTLWIGLPPPPPLRWLRVFGTFIGRILRLFLWILSSLMGGSRPIFLFLLSSVSASGLLRFPALVPASLFGLLG